MAEVVRELGLKRVDTQRVDDERWIRRYITPEAIPGLITDGVPVCSTAAHQDAHQD